MRSPAALGLGFPFRDAASPGVHDDACPSCWWCVQEPWVQASRGAFGGQSCIPQFKLFHLGTN